MYIYINKKLKSYMTEINEKLTIDLQNFLADSLGEDYTEEEVEIIWNNSLHEDLRQDIIQYGVSNCGDQIILSLYS